MFFQIIFIVNNSSAKVYLLEICNLEIALINIYQKRNKYNLQVIFGVELQSILHINIWYNSDIFFIEHPFLQQLIPEK